MWAHNSYLHLSLNLWAHKHRHIHTQIRAPEQIKGFPPTVVVALQDDHGLDPKYQLISADQWPTSQPATARLTDTTHLKDQPKAQLQAACWILYHSNDSPLKPRTIGLSVPFFSVALCRSLSPPFFFVVVVIASNSVFLLEGDPLWEWKQST